MFERSSVFLSLAVAGAAAWLAPSSASACEPLPPGLTSSVPAEGDLPANSAVLFFGQSLSLTGVSVSVDGSPAALVEAPAVAGAALAARIEPQPQPGQAVVISGDFCQESGGCGPSMLSFTATAPDLTPPAAITEGAFFAVYDHADFVSSGGDCQYDSDLTYYVHVVDGAAAGDARTVFTASWDPDGEGPAPAVFGRSALGQGGASSFSISITSATLQGADPVDGVCLSMTVADLAGNTPATYEVCPACYHRMDDLNWDSSTPSEPTWTAEDAVPGSVCAPAVESTGGESSGSDSGGSPTEGGGSSAGGGSSEGATGQDTSASGGEDGGEKGCACDSRGASTPGLLVLLLAGLGLRRRR